MLSKILLIAAGAVCAPVSNPPETASTALSLSDAHDSCTGRHRLILRGATKLVWELKIWISEHLALSREALEKLENAQRIEARISHRAFLLRAKDLELGAIAERADSEYSSLTAIISQNYDLHTEARRFLEAVKLYLCALGVDCSCEPEQLLEPRAFEHTDCDKMKETMVACGDSFSSAVAKLIHRVEGHPCAGSKTRAEFHISSAGYQLAMLRYIERALCGLLTSSALLARNVGSLHRTLLQIDGLGDLDESSARDVYDQIYPKLQECLGLLCAAYDEIAQEHSKWCEDISEAISQADTHVTNRELMEILHSE
ncbi:hypothetical protein PAPHI01_2413 [Pancytospora philotis]|nr:hypothetical protein PAPHI01_2413 [Pancytospora philotis]